MAENQFRIYDVDIDKAVAAQEFMLDYISAHPGEFDPVEKAAENVLAGLLLTAVQTGLVENGSQQLLELQGKIFMAFELGFVYGKLGADKVGQ